MSDGNPRGQWTSWIRDVLIAGGVFSAVTVFLGRLWTTTYFDYFGLPTSDLTLDADDYAFRTKEVLFMLFVAAAVAGGIVWKREPPHSPRPPPRAPESAGTGDAGHEGGSDSDEDRERHYGLVSLLVLSLTLGALVVFGVMAFREWPWVEAHWRWLAVGLGLAVGAAIGVLVARFRSEASWFDVMASTVLIVLLLGFVPPSIVRLARASAANNVRTQNLAHAVIEFTGDAPLPIRRADNPQRSTRVYLVLLTPKRIAVAFPYPCTHVATQVSPEAKTGVCDILAFDRDEVRSVRIFGKSGRPANDTSETAEPVLLDAIEDDPAPRTAYEETFDFAAAEPDDLECADAPSSEDVQGVWFRLVAVQAGRVEPRGSDDRSRFYAVSPDDADDCHAIEPGGGVRLSVGEEVLVFATRPARGETPRGDVEFVFVPLAVRATDCRVADGERQGPREVQCPDAGADVLSFAFSLPRPATASVAVEMTDPSGDASGCPESFEAQPLVLLSGHELSAGECRVSSDGGGRISIVYSATEPLTAGPWTLAVCARSGNQGEIDNRVETDNQVVIDGAMVTSTPLMPASGPTPPDDADAAASADEDGVESPGVRPIEALTPSPHDPGFPCPTGGAAGASP